MFQSSPALSSGRYVHRYQAYGGGFAFQSSPALSSGRYAHGRVYSGVVRGFNPRPPFRAGATGAGHEHDTKTVVSILARPFERALQSGRVGEQRDRLFQSSPALSSGRYRLGLCSYGGDHGFQSSPALSSGRYGVLLEHCAGLLGFNPRPPFRAGATRLNRHKPMKAHVSILARPFERALPALTITAGKVDVFQSSPALSSGRYPRPRPSRCAAACFNPRPPFRAGATWSRP